MVMVILTLKFRPHREQRNTGSRTQVGILGQSRVKGLSGQTELL